MNLTLLTNLFPPEVEGGYELLAQDVRLALQRRGHTVQVLTTGQQRIEQNVHRTLRLAVPFGKSAGRERARHLVTAAWNRLAVRRYLETEGKPDAVLVMSMRRLGLEPLRAFIDAGVPHVATVNDDWPVSYCRNYHPDGHAPSLWTWPLDVGPWARHSLRDVRFQSMVYLSETIRRQVREAAPWMPEGVVQPQGVDLKKFPSRPFRQVTEPFTMLFAGRLHPSKAPDVALETVASLRRKGIDVSLRIAGRPYTPAYGQQLHELARSLGVEPYVEWLGFVPRTALSKVYQQADIFLFLNRWDEPLGLTYMESMASGVPVVAHPKGGAAELLDRWDATQRAASLSGRAVADAVLKLVHDESRQRQLVNTAQRMLQQEASLDVYVDVLERQLRQAVVSSKET